MPLRLALLLAATLVLAGCTDADWNHTMSFAGLDDAPPPRPVAQVVPPARPAPQAIAPAQPAIDPFCQGVANADATRNAFDAQTQSRVFAQSYSQCLTMIGSGH